MKHEKSCGAVVYRVANDKLEFLLIKSKKYGHWGFPKGHVESGENELETATREIHEETGLSVDINDKFRKSVDYSLSAEAHKEVIFFVAKAMDQSVIMQPEEVLDYKWLDFVETYKLLTFDSSQEVLLAAKEFLNNNN